MAKIVTADYELDPEVPSLKNMTDNEFIYIVRMEQLKKSFFLNKKISGENILPGFELDLSILK